MSDRPTSAADLAAAQVEQIVQAAQAAAEGIKEEAQVEHQDRRRQAEREAEEIREQARLESNQSVDGARQQAHSIGEEARRQARQLVETAERETTELRDRTRKQVEGRVAAAEKAASEVLEEARTLSAGLNRLGQSLGEQAERILRDVTAAHRRMQADLHIGPESSPGPAPSRSVEREPRPSPPPEAEPKPSRSQRRGARPRSGSRGDQATPEEAEALKRAAERARREDQERAPVPARRRANPFDDIETPGWVGPDG